MKGFEFETVKGVAAALVINVSITLLLIPAYGADGAAIGALVSQLTWNLLLIIRTYKLTGLNTTFINKSLIK